MKNPQGNYATLPLDEEVRNRILMEQMPQVRYIARHIHDRLPQHVPMEDLVHAGVLGLMDALTKYDDARQVQFKTYAKFRIRGAILDSLRELDWSPRDLRRKARLIELASARLSHELGRAATEQELASELGLTLDSFQHLLGEIEGLDLGSFHIATNDKEHDDDLCEYLPGNPEESPYYLTMKSELRQYLIPEAYALLDAAAQQLLEQKWDSGQNEIQLVATASPGQGGGAARSSVDQQNQDKARAIIETIYGLLDRNDLAGAALQFENEKAFLQAYLDKDTYELVRLTVVKSGESPR